MSEQGVLEYKTMDGEINAGPWPGAQRPGSEALYEAQNLARTEYGLWTPVVVGSTTAGAATYTSTRFGIYYRIGNLVNLICNVQWSAHTGTGTPVILGFPFRPISPSATDIGWWGDGILRQAGADQQMMAHMASDQYWASSAWTAVSYPRVSTYLTATAAVGGNVAAGGTCGVRFSLFYLAEVRLT